MKQAIPIAPDDARHFPILDALQGKGNVSQRRLAERIGMAASNVNRMIRELTDLGHLEVVDPDVRPFAYRLTAHGRGYLRRLSRDHFRGVLDDFQRMRRRIGSRLRGIREEGHTRLVFYGAGDVMEVALPLAREFGLEVLAVVDDDPEKQGSERAGLRVHAPDCVAALGPDAVLITSFRHAEEIERRLEGRLPASIPILEL